MRTVIVTTSYPSRPDDPAGHFVRTEAQALVAQGNDVHVVAPTGEHGGLVADAGICTWPIAHGGAFGWPGAAYRLKVRPWRLAGAAAFAARASSRLVDLHPDRIIAHWIVPSAYPVAWSSRFAHGVEAVAHGADVRMLLALPAPVRAQLMTRVLATASTLRFAARASYDALSSSLPEPLREALSHRARFGASALSVPDVSTAAKGIKAAFGSRALAVTVSRLVASKRVELAIEAAHRLHPKVVFGVVGDGPERGRLGRVPGAELVRFEGGLARDHALAWIAAADVLVHPSVAEAAPTVIREARLLGTPVVACDAGDVRAWAKVDAGIVVAQPDGSSLAAAIERII